MKKHNKNMDVSPSKKDFEQLFNGNIPEKQRSKLLQEIEKDEFSKEAYLGFASTPDAVEDLGELNKTIHSKSGRGINQFYSKLIIGSAALIISTFIIFYFLKNNSEEKKLLKPNLPITATDTHQFNLVIREVENAKPIAESKQITSSKAKTEQNNVAQFERETPPEIMKKIQTSNISNNTSSEINSPETQASILKMEYMFDLKVINYNNTHRINIKRILPDGGSLAPKFENYQKTYSAIANDENSSFISYHDFLHIAMGEFSTNNYKDALKYFNNILQQYPDDLNAHFYGGLSYYNLGLNDKAIHYFDAVIESNTSNFLQEAAWYKALCLVNSGMEEEAKAILVKIIESKGFYADRAKKLMVNENL